MKKILKAIFGILFLSLIIALVFSSARVDYSWSELMIRKKTAEGWTLAATSDNYVDILSPWTLFKTPVTGLWFIKLNDLTQNGPFIAGSVLHISYDYSKTEQEEYIELFDIEKGKSAFLLKDTNIELYDPSSLEWNDYPPGSPGDKLIKFIQKNRSNYENAF